MNLPETFTDTQALNYARRYSIRQAKPHRLKEKNMWVMILQAHADKIASWTSEGKINAMSIQREYAILRNELRAAYKIVN